MVGEHWESEAENWVRWARKPEHDAFWDYAPRFFEEIVPGPAGATLEVGCGEGRVARRLVELGHRVVAVDASPTLIRHAREVDSRTSYLLADAAALPLGDAAFDLVVAYNSLMDVDDMPKAIAEVARVLVPGGRFCSCVTHPVSDAGRFESNEPDAPFTIPGPYLGRRPLEVMEERAGLTMTFHGWAYALEDYARALEASGFLIEKLREPPAPAEAVRRDLRAGRWTRIPNFLFLRAIKR